MAIFIAGIGEDFEPNLTIGQLKGRIDDAISQGVSLDSKLSSGYSPDHLRECMYVDLPEDLTGRDLPYLVNLIRLGQEEERRAAQDEIERRITGVVV